MRERKRERERVSEREKERERKREREGEDRSGSEYPAGTNQEIKTTPKVILLRSKDQNSINVS